VHQKNGTLYKEVKKTGGRKKADKAENLSNNKGSNRKRNSSTEKKFPGEAQLTEKMNRVLKTTLWQHL